MLLSALPEAEHVMAVGNGRKFLSVIITGNLSSDRIESALNNVNQALPHYKQIRRFVRSPEPFTVESGLLTANRKLKRGLIEAHFRSELEALYATAGDPERERVAQ
jgi:long-chain acyl-CoA synthetase